MPFARVQTATKKDKRGEILNIEYQTAEVRTGLRNSSIAIRYSTVQTALYRLRSGPFEEPATGKPPALPEYRYFRSTMGI
jgi:hypothetical protein